jgi:hypothetical protein
MIEQTKMFDDAGAETIDKKLADGKGGMTSKQLKAVSWYSDSHGYRLRLSNPPMQMHFIDKRGGAEITVTLSTIISEYDAWNSEDKKSRAAERKRAKELEKEAAKRVLL